MPIYPALALLIGSAISAGGRRIRTATGVLLAISMLLCVALTVLIALVWRLPHGRQHFDGPDPTSRTVHAVDGPHSRPDA